MADIPICLWPIRVACMTKDLETVIALEAGMGDRDGSDMDGIRKTEGTPYVTHLTSFGLLRSCRLIQVSSLSTCLAFDSAPYRIYLVAP